MSQESLRCPGTFNTAVGASLGQEHTAGLGRGQTEWAVGMGCLAALPLECHAFYSELCSQAGGPGRNPSPALYSETLDKALKLVKSQFPQLRDRMFTAECTPWR